MAKPRSTLFIVLSPTGIAAAPFLGKLRTHPQLICHDDMEGPLSPTAFSWLGLKPRPASKADAEFKRDFPEAFLYKHVFDSRGSQAVGFAVDHDTLLSPLNARMRNVLHHDTDVKILMYAPHNILRAYAEDVARQQAGARTVEVEAPEFVLHAKQMDRMSAYVKRFFDSHERLRVDTEGLLRSRVRSTLKDVAKFLDLDPYPDNAAAGDKPQPELGALISNLAALKSALQDTPYSWMLEA